MAHARPSWPRSRPLRTAAKSSARYQADNLVTAVERRAQPLGFRGKSGHAPARQIGQTSFRVGLLPPAPRYAARSAAESKAGEAQNGLPRKPPGPQYGDRPASCPRPLPHAVAALQLERVRSPSGSSQVQVENP